MQTASVAFSYVSQFISEFELEYLTRVMIGGILGIFMGIERSHRQKEAGIGTHFIVACAAALLTCISLWFKKDAGDMGDGARIAAQIVSGVGFLGAGMIFSAARACAGLPPPQVSGQPPPSVCVPPRVCTFLHSELQLRSYFSKRSITQSSQSAMQCICCS